ncbi:MAG: hypothetical protein ACE5D3_08680 [Candidatus Binatia bacterium]
MEKLDAGAQFPTLELKLLEGGSLVVPDDLETDYAVLLFYRGHW